jgi:hypothetical protein
MVDTFPQNFLSRERQVWQTPAFSIKSTFRNMRTSGMVNTLPTRFTFTRMPDGVDTLFYKIYIQKHYCRMSGRVDNHIPEDLLRNRMSGTRSTSRNTRMSDVMDTIFYKIFIQKHEIIRYVDIVDTLVYKVYIQKQENVR